MCHDPWHCNTKWIKANRMWVQVKPVSFSVWNTDEVYVNSAQTGFTWSINLAHLRHRCEYVASSVTHWYECLSVGPRYFRSDQKNQVSNVTADDMNLIYITRICDCIIWKSVDHKKYSSSAWQTFLYCILSTMEI